MSQEESTGVCLARKVAGVFSASPSVEAVALGGSQVSGCAGSDSDVDVYVYTTSTIPVHDRKEIAAELGAVDPKFNPTPFWDVCDVWQDPSTGLRVEAIYWGTAWIQDMLDRVLVKHKAQNGYSTSHWYTIRNCLCLYDRSGWFAALQTRSSQPYPDQLRQAILVRNHPILSTYRNQIAQAIRRGDLVSINHRLAALLESYFDVLFAFNRVLHPGEKRLLTQAAQRCQKTPANMPAQVVKALRSASSADDGLLIAVDELIEGLDRLLLDEGLGQ